MEEFAEIIGKIKKQEMLFPPDDLVAKIMSGIQKAEDGFHCKIYRLLFQRRQLSSDAAGILTGKIFSPVQCAFLLFGVGLFYLFISLFVIWGIKDILVSGNINLWLKTQPYIAIFSAFLIILLAIMLLKKPQTISFAKHIIVVHTIFIVIDALVIQFMLFSIQAIIFALVLTVAAIILGFMLISSISDYMKGGLLTKEKNFA